MYLLHITYNSKPIEHCMIAKAALVKLRHLMASRNIGVFVLPRTDEHQSEYLSPPQQRVKFLSGFTGSNALALVSQKQALLWTDGRYFLQAQQQLGPEWQMRKLVQGQKKWFEHISSDYEPKQTKINIDGRLITANSAKQRLKKFTQKGYSVQFDNSNLVDEIWEGRPQQVMREVFLHEQHAGKSLGEKVKWIRNQIIDKKGEGAIFTQLGEICWILNLRSSQIPYNPFFKAILVIQKEGGCLYLPQNHPTLFCKTVAYHLWTEQIKIKSYEPELKGKLLCQPNQINYSLYSKIKDPIEWEGIGLKRAIRTDKQIEGFRRCHLADGIAMAKFWSWRSTMSQVGEHEAACYLDNLRSQQKGNMGLSFATISGGGPNGAIIHYHATKQSSATVTKNMVHLVDSGGQYLDGTTDVTRAFHFGTPTDEEKDVFTRVLLGNLDLERLKWPTSAKLTGSQVQILARRHLWRNGYQYFHGTGHGVGFFGSVHEGPVGISKNNKTVLEPNMIVTNEPGCYLPGKFGVRIENMLVVRADSQGHHIFQNLTLCPYDKNLMKLELLSNEDIKYINEYHDNIWRKLHSQLVDDPQALKWLRAATEPICLPAK